MSPNTFTGRVFAGAVLALVALSAPARAAFVADSYVTIAGTPETSNPGFFTGKIEVDNISSTQAAIRITLTNTSPIGNGGYITGFAFNLPGTITSASLTSSYVPQTGQDFQLIGGSSYDNSISGSPYGDFDIGAAVGGNFLGNGQPSGGLAVNETGKFTFTLNSTSYDLNTLTAKSLMEALSSNAQGGGAVAMLVRFRGFGDGSSDKVVAGNTCPPPSVVPAPPGVLLGLIGFGGCLLGRNLRRRTAPAAA